MPTNQTASLVATNDIRDIKPPVAIPGWEWLWWTWTILVAVALLVWAWRYWQKRRTQVLLVPPIPAHIRAKQKLQEALALLAQPKPFCILVSDTIRGYLEERFSFREPELRDLHSSALRLIEETEPLPEPTTSGKNQASRITHHETADSR